MPFGDKSWSDRAENYAGGYTKNITGTTSTTVMEVDYTQPAVVYSFTVAVGNAGATGEVSLIDGSATADTDTTMFAMKVASGLGEQGTQHFTFPRGISFDKGIVISATTVTGNVSLTYKRRYA